MGHFLFSPKDFEKNIVPKDYFYDIDDSLYWLSVHHISCKWVWGNFYFPDMNIHISLKWHQRNWLFIQMNMENLKFPLNDGGTTNASL